jgi:phospholipid/cholesterol/gamma-HCH transport system substrate-binding protein
MRSRPSRVTVGLAALVAVCVVTFLVFTKDIPFTRGYEIKAVFASSNSLRPDSPVRIAGVQVGKVTAVDAQDGGDGAVVTMAISDTGRPVHEDATARIRPRIFLEGNFFVDLQPGTPGAPELDDRGTIKVTQTATPVQLDQVLSALQSDSRQDLRDVLEGLGTALSSEPSAADDRDADPSARGETAAQSWNDAYDDIGPAERGVAQVNEALLGVEPQRDLSRLLEGAGRTAAGLVRNEDQLQELVSGFNRTMAALASEDTNLRASIRELAPTLANANRALASLNAAFPATRAFAREILPGVRQTAATIDAAFPWIAQVRGLLSEEELQGLAADLAPAGRDLARVADSSIDLLPQTDLASRCARDVLLPTGDVVIRDEFQTGRENYKDFFYALVGLAGEGQNFDGNGMYVRLQTGGGAQRVFIGQGNAGSPPQFGGLPTPPLGNRPAFPGRVPAYVDDQRCHTQPLPDLNGPAAARTPPYVPTGATTTAVRRGGSTLTRLRTHLDPATEGGR